MVPPVEVMVARTTPSLATAPLTSSEVPGALVPMPTRPLACTRIRSTGVPPLLVLTISGAALRVPSQLLPSVLTLALPPSAQAVLGGAASARAVPTATVAAAAVAGTAIRNRRGKRRSASFWRVGLIAVPPVGVWRGRTPTPLCRWCPRECLLPPGRAVVSQKRRLQIVRRYVTA